MSDATLQHIWRHPIKSHGVEEVAQVHLRAGQTMPGDRVWAVLHDAAKADGSTWASCVNFSIGSKAPKLMAISARLSGDGKRVHLQHPELDDLTLNPDEEGEKLIGWTKPLIPEGRAQSSRVVRVPGRGMTDTDYPSLSLLNMASNEVLSAFMGVDLNMCRWRGNLWVDGLKPWEEFRLVGQHICIGEVEAKVVEPIRRCRATTANPLTGDIDADTLKALNASQHHQNFGVYLSVVKGGTIRPQDRVVRLV